MNTLTRGTLVTKELEQMDSLWLRPAKKLRLQKLRKNAHGNSNRSKARSHINVEQMEPRIALSVYVRPIDEIGNNIDHPTWGTPGVALLRREPVVHYFDGINSPALPGNPSARYISNALSDQTDP